MRFLVLVCWQLKLAITGIFLGLLFVAQCNAFGILFTSPEQRAQLDGQREHGTIFRSVVKSSKGLAHSPESDRVVFNGYVKRRAGHGTAWVNNKVVKKDEENRGISVNLMRVKNVAVSVKPGPSMAAVNLKPGQSISVRTGLISEGYINLRAMPTSPTNKGDTDKTVIMSDENGATPIESDGTVFIK
ncbi:MAG: hypothetical protein KUG71_08585 [Porticoccaceae bacterium]|nr:hypothetical protein [Porticoccaceae bacterium]